MNDLAKIKQIKGKKAIYMEHFSKEAYFWALELQASTKDLHKVPIKLGVQAKKELKSYKRQLVDSFSQAMADMKESKVPVVGFICGDLSGKVVHVSDGDFIWCISSFTEDGAVAYTAWDYMTNLRKIDFFHLWSTTVRGQALLSRAATQAQY